MLTGTAGSVFQNIAKDVVNTIKKKVGIETDNEKIIRLNLEQVERVGMVRARICNAMWSKCKFFFKKYILLLVGEKFCFQKSCYFFFL